MNLCPFVVAVCAVISVSGGRFDAGESTNQSDLSESM
jgi:hypothetical protein